MKRPAETTLRKSLTSKCKKILTMAAKSSMTRTLASTKKKLQIITMTKTMVALPRNPPIKMPSQTMTVEEET